MIFFSSQISCTACTLTEMRHNLDFFRQDKRVFVSFVKLLNILDNKSLIFRVFIEAEMILFSNYAQFHIIWLRVVSIEFLHF